MTTESTFRALFWALFGGALAMRVYFSLQVRRAGERLMPDDEAVAREGRAMFAIRVLLFALLIAWLALYAVNPPWLGMLSVPLPGWLRWVGFAVGLAGLALWTWTQAALGTHRSPHAVRRREVGAEGFRPAVPPGSHQSGGQAACWGDPWCAVPGYDATGRIRIVRRQEAATRLAAIVVPAPPPGCTRRNTA